MIIDRTHIGWGVLTVLVTAGLTLLYLANNDPELLPGKVPTPSWMGPSPPLRVEIGATPLGLLNGTMALAIFIFAALLGWRRSHPSWKLGRMQVWLKAHIWLTVWTIPLVLFHCGFKTGGPMTLFLMVLYALVMISGFWGLALQQIIPRLMRESLPEEAIFEEIPFLRNQLVAQAEGVLETLSAPLPTTEAADHGHRAVAVAVSAPPVESIRTIVQFLEKDAVPYLKAANPRRSRLFDQAAADGVFRLLALQVPDSTHPMLDQVRDLCDEKRRLDFQIRLHRWLHGWLFFHAPASVLLVVVTIWHALVAAFTYA